MICFTSNHRLPLVGVYPILLIVFVAVRVTLDFIASLLLFRPYTHTGGPLTFGTNLSLRALKKTHIYQAVELYLQPRMNCIVAQI